MNVGEPGNDAHLAYLRALLAPYTRRSTDGITEPEPSPAPEPSVFVSPAVEEVLPPADSTDPGGATVFELQRREAASDPEPFTPRVVEPLTPPVSETSRVPSPGAEHTVPRPAASGGRHASRAPAVPAVPADAGQSTETDEDIATLLRRRSAQ